MAELNPVTTIAASGAARTLSADGSVDPVYDVTMTANCTISLAGTANGRMQTITAIFRQDATGGRVISLPSIRWPAGFVPVLSSAAGAEDIMQFVTTDGSTWRGFMVGSNLIASTLSITSIASGGAGSNLPVAVAYIGTPPTNLDYSIDGGAFTTLGAGVATISNGVASFNLVAPSLGTYALRVRATGTNNVSPPANFTVTASQAPSAVSVSGTPGNAQNALSMTGTANGAAITTFTVQRATSAGGTYTNVGTATPSSTPANGVTTATFTDTGITNGTPYFYKVIANTTAGNVTSAASASLTPAVGASPPSDVYASGNAGNASNVIAVTGLANGAAITTFTIQRATTSGGTYTNVGTATPSTTPTTGTTTASFTDSGLTNGTTYFYKATANTTAGNLDGPEYGPVTPAVPTSGVVAKPAHYMQGDTTRTSRIMVPDTATKSTDGYMDVMVWFDAPSFVINQYLVSRWQQGGNTTNAIFDCGIQATSGKLQFEWYGTSAYKQILSSVALGALPTTSGLWVRFQVNATAAAITAATGSAVATIPANSIVFSTAQPTTTDPTALTWTQLGSTVAIGAAGVGINTAANPVVTAGNIGRAATPYPFTGKLYKIVARDSAGRLLFNPDWTAQAAGAASFTDTASVSNTWANDQGAQF